MRSKPGPQPSAEQHVPEIRRQTRKRYSSEEKIRVVLEGLRGEYSISELCRREGIAQGLFRAAGTVSYPPLPGDMIAERTNLGFVYVSLDTKRIVDLRDFLKDGPAT